MKEFADMAIEELEAALIVIKNEIESRNGSTRLINPFNPEFGKWKDGTIDVHLPAIYGYDWQVVRKIGIGTYMTHAAGLADEGYADEDDVEEVVEEWTAPDMRTLWDEKTDVECIQACLNTLIPTGGNNE